MTGGLNYSVCIGSFLFTSCAIPPFSEISSTSVEDVESCRQELETAISEAKKSSSPTHFISIPLEGIEVLVKEYTRLVDELMQDKSIRVRLTALMV